MAEVGDFDPFFFTNILRTVTNKKLKRSEAKTHFTNIHLWDQRAKEKLLLLVFQYYTYIDCEGDVENITTENLPYKGSQNGSDVAFKWTGFPGKLQQLLIKFITVTESQRS